MPKESEEKFFYDLDLNPIGKIILLDVDGTIVADSEMDFDKRTLEKIEILKKNNKVYVCTNSRNQTRNEEIGKILRSDLSTSNRGRGKKPSKYAAPDLKGMEGKCIVIGDKFLTDYLFAKNIKADFIRVGRILSGRERKIVKIINFVDDVVYFLFGLF